MVQRIAFGPVFAFECLTTSRRWQVYAGRALLVTGVLDAIMASRFERGRRIATPHLDVRYAPPGA